MYAAGELRSSWLSSARGAGAIVISKASWGCAPALPNQIEKVSQEAIDCMALNLCFLFLQKNCNRISIEKCKNQLTIFKFSAMI